MGRLVTMVMNNGVFVIRNATCNTITASRARTPRREKGCRSPHGLVVQI